ncbi:MAG TPA: molecular chaperone TorD family protein [Bryobacterales bacterium]|nr:molecular chaperone TorD family protein [Bryobacterales bacterium]
MDTPRLYDQLAGLLVYPENGYAVRVAACRASLADAAPPAAAALDELALWAQAHTTEQAQEQFVQTFDLNPVCSLEVGWQLFGENYDRGDFLVRMRGRLREHGIRESAELPDHLSHVLPLLGRLEPAAAAEFWSASVRPALQKMLDSLQGGANPLAGALRAVFLALESRHAAVEQEVSHA